MSAGALRSFRLRRRQNYCSIFFAAGTIKFAVACYFSFRGTLSCEDSSSARGRYIEKEVFHDIGRIAWLICEETAIDRITIFTGI